MVGLYDRLRSARDAADLRAAAEQRRDLISDLVEAAQDLLERGRHAPSATTRERIAQTLYAAGADEDRDVLLHGRLTGELQPSGFEQLAGFELAPFTPAPVDHRARRRAEQLEQQASEAEAEASRLERAAKETDRAAKDAARSAERAARDAGIARERAARARQRAEEARGGI